MASTLVSSPRLFDTRHDQAYIRGSEATISLGFGRTPQVSARVAKQAVAQPWTTTAASTTAAGTAISTELKDAPASAASVEDEYLASVLVVAAGEDKLNPGAVVASPSAPWVWGNEVPDLSSPSGAYHLVWSRDSYEFATALWAAGDKAAARRIVDWLFEVQQKEDGSFPQNSDVQGTPVWGELQLDEVALPIVLARLVGRTGAKTWPRSAQGGPVPHRLPRRGDRAPGAVLTPGTLGEPVRLLAQLHRCADLRPGLRRRHRAQARAQGPRTEMAEDRRPLAAQGRRLDGHAQRAAQRRAVLPAADQERRAGHRVAVRDGRRRAGRASTSAKSSTRASSPWCGSGCARPTTPRSRTRSRWSTQNLKVDTPNGTVLAPLQPRRVRRDPHRRRVGDHRPRHGHHPRSRLADPDRRARRVRRLGRPGRGAVPRRDGRRRQRQRA